MRKYFLNKKYKMFLFFPLAAVAILYLIGAAEISYIFNVPMIMSPMQAGMPMQMGQAIGKPVKGIEKTGLLFFSKTGPQHSNKLNLESSITCVECQNLPAAYRPALFYSGSFIKTISFTGKIYATHFSSDIPHPPQNPLV
jgi:hypothetical protein